MGGLEGGSSGRAKDGFRRSGCRDWVRMAVHELPFLVLDPEYARDPKIHDRHVCGAADSSAEALDFHDAGQILGFVCPDALEPYELAVPIPVRCIAGSCHDILGTTHERSERVAESDVVLNGEQFGPRGGVTANELTKRRMTLFNNGVER